LPPFTTANLKAAFSCDAKSQHKNLTKVGSCF